MPLAVPQTSTMGTVTYPFSLLLDGLDLIRREGTAPTVGVPVDSIELTEAGPGAVSSLRFTIEDPGTSAQLPTTGSTVQFWDLTNNVPLFRGTVNSWQAIPRGVGRSIVVDCDGIEKLLDNIVPSETWAFTGSAFQLYHYVIQQLGRWSRADNLGTGGSNDGTRALPIGTLFSSQPPPGAALTITGTTVRQAIVQANAVMQVASGAILVAAPPPNITIDWYGGLRAWREGFQPDDYTTLTITDTAAGARAAVNINYEVHPGDIVHEVYILGGGGISGWYSDGTGIIGNQAYISDSTLTTADLALNAAQAYLAGQASTVRGSFKLDAFNPATTVHAGGLVSITDASLGLAAQTFIIQTIRKTFAAGSPSLQSWEVHFGGRRPSAMQELRNLNRSVLN